MPEGNVWLGLLKQRLAEYDAITRNASREEVGKCQGKALAIQELITDLESAGKRSQHQASGSIAHRGIEPRTL